MRKFDPIHQRQRQRPARWLPFGTSLLVLVLLFGGLGLNSGVARAQACQSLIQNGDMETETDWSARTNGNYALFSDYSVRSGRQAAYLAGVNNAEDSLSRNLTLPADHTVTLSFWWRLNTEETSSGWDSLTVLLADANGAPLRVLLSLGDRNASPVWQQADLDLSEFAGQLVQLQFNARTDGSLPSDFFIDDVTLMACDRSAAESGTIFLPILRR